MKKALGETQTLRAGYSN